MDWSKAKSILIVAFLITNILLGIFVMTSKKEEDPTLKKDFLRNVELMLNEKDIKLNANIPTEKPSLEPIIVEYETINPFNINDVFFNGEGKIISKEEGVIEITKGSEIINIKNTKVLDYRNESESIKFEDLDEQMARKIAFEFIEDKNLKREGMELSSISKKDGTFIIRFSKFYNDRYVERAYLNFYIDKKGINSVKRLWLDIKGDGEKDIYINTAPKSLLSLLDMDGIEGRSIEDISLCYYFDPEEHAYLDASKNAKRGKTVPAWRILLDDGNRIIIDNY